MLSLQTPPPSRPVLVPVSTTPVSTVNQEQINQLQAEKSKLNEKLATSEGKLSLLEEEKLRILKVILFIPNIDLRFVSKDMSYITSEATYQRFYDMCGDTVMTTYSCSLSQETELRSEMNRELPDKLKMVEAELRSEMNSTIVPIEDNVVN